MIKIAIRNIAGFDEPVIVETIEEGYTDITSVSNWIKYGDYLFRDYKYIRRRLQEEAINWDNLTIDDKTIIAQYQATTEDRCKATLTDSYASYRTDWGKRSKECREFRYERAITELTVNIDVPSRFIVLGALNPTGLESLYKNVGLEGTNDGDPMPGLFNWIEDGGLGALQLTFINGYTMEGLITSLMQILRHGNY